MLLLEKRAALACSVDNLLLPRVKWWFFHFTFFISVRGIARRSSGAHEARESVKAERAKTENPVPFSMPELIPATIRDKYSHLTRQGIISINCRCPRESDSAVQ